MGTPGGPQGRGQQGNCEVPGSKAGALGGTAGVGTSSQGQSGGGSSQVQSEESELSLIVSEDYCCQ